MADDRRKLWLRVPALWKTLGLIAAIAATGWAVAGYMGRFVTHAELDERAQSARQVTAEVTRLSQAVERQNAEIKAAADVARHADDGITQLLMRLVATPPPRKDPP